MKWGKRMLAMNYVYIVQCRDQTLYTGWTTDLARRVAAHNAGRGGKYTCRRLPVRLVYFEEYEEKSTALKREYALKQLTHKEKLALIEGRKAM